jgi:hypothetical protein
MIGFLALIPTPRPTRDSVELDPGIVTFVSDILRAIRASRQRTAEQGAAGATCGRAGRPSQSVQTARCA